MVVTSAAQYLAVKAAMESIGFTGMPSPASLDFSIPNAFVLNANFTAKHASVTTDPPVWLTAP